ncbi:hypothetical protein [Halorarius halobius]|uniref:hypothetical protein n=1 Tax=Halorarius halobius TaxID=2962671 RepID=UPI0020CBE5D7|nr:hypothetical protein [Halorarius halobius]
MSAGHSTRQWERAERHPRLPGEDLVAFELVGSDDVCMYDDDNPDAYLIGDGVEVGTRR